MIPRPFSFEEPRRRDGDAGPFKKKNGTSFSSVTFLFLLLEFMTVIAAANANATYANDERVTADKNVVNRRSGEGGIPQHRVRVTNRKIAYGPYHPWIQKDASRKVTATADTAATGRRTKEQDPFEIPTLFNWTIVSNTQSSSTTTQHVSTTHNITHNVTHNITNTNTTTTTTTLQHKPIRIRASFINHISSGVMYLTPTQRTFILNSILQPALNTWSEALSVVPVQDSLVIDLDQLYDGKSCGPGIDSGMPSVVVPIDHGREGVGGIPDTDLMIYLSVAFVEELKDSIVRPHDDVGSISGTSSSGSSNYMTPETLMDDELLQFVHGKDGNGEEEEEESFMERSSDFGLTNSNSTSSTISTNSWWEEQYTTSLKPLEEETILEEPNTCTGSYLASATYCATDQWDRPVAGMLHLCIGPHFFEEKFLHQHVTMATHELGHILGFNAQR